jgi:hypothetical protein
MITREKMERWQGTQDAGKRLLIELAYDELAQDELAQGQFR